MKSRNIIVYDKLVRDKVPQIMLEAGKEFYTRVATKEQYQQKLQEKLIEEAREFLEDPSIEELADVAEVFGTILATMNIDIDELERVMLAKREARGSFDNRIVLECVNTRPRK
jgi:predicted house-cleaning noncanonical NTP pyrophosphatase (MazG superfamily)